MSEQHFNETYGSKAPENYERFFVPAIGKPLAEDLVRLAELSPGEKVLDVACGTGTVARIASRKVGRNGSVAGLDANPGMLAVARSVTPPNMLIEWYEASAEAMPLQDGAFDVVMCQLSLQFIEEKVIALQEMRRVLVSGGRIVLNVPGPKAGIFAILADSMNRHISAQACEFVNHVFSLYDTDEILQLMSNAGFNDIDMRKKNKTLHLPSPEKFLWQYVYSTPLASVISETDEKSRIALENDVVNKWQDFTENDAMTYRQHMVTAIARK